jgi:hypothetical protein
MILPFASPVHYCATRSGSRPPSSTCFNDTDPRLHVDFLQVFQNHDIEEAFQGSLVPLGHLLLVIDVHYGLIMSWPYLGHR